MRSNEKFTQRAELAIESARAEAGELGHSSVGTEHLLLGILAEPEGLGAHILRRQGLEREQLRRLVVREQGMGCPGVPVQGLTVAARTVLERAAKEAAALRCPGIGTEHLLLGILRDPDCGAMRALAAAGADANSIYTEIMAVFGNPDSRGRTQTGVLRSPVRHAETRILDQYSRVPLGFAPGETEEGAMQEAVRAELRRTFRPEFLNRVDETVIFRRLDEADLLAITRGLLRQEAQRFEALGLHLEVPEAAARRLAELGRSADFGARPLRRVIRREITDRGAQMLLEGSAEAGDTLRAICEGGQIRLIKSE